MIAVRSAVLVATQLPFRKMTRAQAQWFDVLTCNALAPANWPIIDSIKFPSAFCCAGPQTHSEFLEYSSSNGPNKFGRNLARYVTKPLNRRNSSFVLGGRAIRVSILLSSGCMPSVVKICPKYLTCCTLNWHFAALSCMAYFRHRSNT